MFRWFKNRRRLHEDLRLLNVIIADHEQTIASLNEEMKELEAITEIRLDSLRRVANHQRNLLTAHEQKNARLVEELKALRDEIRDAEQEQPVGIHPNLPSATGAGMARPPRPRFDRTAARLRQQGVPADLADDEDGATC